MVIESSNFRPTKIPRHQIVGKKKKNTSPMVWWLEIHIHNTIDVDTPKYEIAG